MSSAGDPSSSPSSDMEGPSPTLIPLDPPPKRPQFPLEWPPDGSLTLDWIQSLTAAFDWSSRNLPPSELRSVLPVPVLQRLLLAASGVLRKEPNLVRVDADEGSAVVVVGDLHGQLHDLIFLLEQAGLPSEGKCYVFNGDYVDRGAWGLETFLILAAWKVLFPRRVFLLRGNHESAYCTSVYGFKQEVIAKYGDQGQFVYRRCLRCFEDLPLASIIAGCVYTAHGGLFRSINITRSKRTKGKKGRKIISDVDTKPFKLGSLEELMKARRTILDPPWEGLNLIPGDVLWSDPSSSQGLSPNTQRGIGLLWGPDCTEEFLKKNNLKVIIRSHEGPDARDKRDDLGGMQEGYTIDHEVDSGKLITIFSAPDYPQFQATDERYNNRGAYILLHPPDFTTPVFCTFEAIKPRPPATAFYDFEEVIDSDEELDLKSMDTSSSYL